jgi:hypothetical protein
MPNMVWILHGTLIISTAIITFIAVHYHAKKKFIPQVPEKVQ